MNPITLDAEVSVLGALLLEGHLITNLVLENYHFTNADHQQIFQTMKKVHADNKCIDVVTVTTELGEDVSKVGGVSYLLELAQSVPSTASLPHYERILLEAYRNRKAKDLALKFSEDPNEEGLEKLLKDLADCQKVGGPREEKSTFDYLVDITDEMCFPSPELSGFLTNFSNLDEMTGGFQRGDLIIVAARPSVGKTAFALNIAARHCTNEGTTSVFSLEMGNKQLLQRMIAAEGLIFSQKWRSMAFNQQDFHKAFDVIGKITKWNLHLHEKARTIGDIRATLRKTVHDQPKARHLAIIDYLQLITPTGRRERRDLEVGEMTRELKLLALELKIPIILLSQLSRGVEQRNEKRPLMSDLRESGNIEQDADVIAFLYRDDYYNRDTEKPKIVEIIISKQRNGPTGTVELLFHKEFGRFTDTGGTGTPRGTGTTGGTGTPRGTGTPVGTGTPGGTGTPRGTGTTGGTGTPRGTGTPGGTGTAGPC